VLKRKFVSIGRELHAPVSDPREPDENRCEIRCQCFQCSAVCIPDLGAVSREPPSERAGLGALEILGNQRKRQN